MCKVNFAKFYTYHNWSPAGLGISEEAPAGLEHLGKIDEAWVR